MCALVSPPRPYMTSFGPGWVIVSLILEKRGAGSLVLLDVVVDVASSDILRLFFALLANVIIMLGAASSVEFIVDDVLRLLLRRGVESFISSSEEEVMVKTSR